MRHFDLADGQELFVKTVKTPKRYPTRALSVGTNNIDVGLAAPAWAIARADTMVGFTQEDTGSSPRAYMASPSPDVNIRLRADSNPSETNNFDSYDLLQRPSRSSDAYLAPENFMTPYRSRYLWPFRATVGKKGQIEGLQTQATMPTLLNRADTDGDGLSGSEELALGSDGLPTDPWKVDTDGDTIGDALEYAAGPGPARRSSRTRTASGRTPRERTLISGRGVGRPRPMALVDAYVTIKLQSYGVVTHSRNYDPSSGQIFCCPYATVRDAKRRRLRQLHGGQPMPSHPERGYVWRFGSFEALRWSV